MALDAVVRVRPGEQVPMDGVVTEGNSSINQAPVTGESIPVDKAVGDPVFAGTINETGTFEFKVNEGIVDELLTAWQDLPPASVRQMLSGNAESFYRLPAGSEAPAAAAGAPSA